MSQISAGPRAEGKHLQADAEVLIRERSPEDWVSEHDIEILDQPVIRPHPKLRHGFVVDEILQEAREGDYDLVIIGAHLKKGWRGVLLDDIVHKILKWIDRSILVVHREADFLRFVSIRRVNYGQMPTSIIYIEITP